MMLAVSSGAAVRAMRRVRLISKRKFWPSDLRAPSSKRRMTSRSGGSSGGDSVGTALDKFAGKRERGDKARRIGDALAGDVERRAVIGGGANERQAERDIDAAI